MLGTPEGITQLRASRPSACNEAAYEKYMKNPAAYPLSSGFDQGKDYTGWILKLLWILFERNIRWMPATKDHVPHDLVYYEVELLEYKAREMRRYRMRQDYKGTGTEAPRMRACQKEVIDMLLAQVIDIDVLDLYESDHMRKVWSEELGRFREPEEIAANERRAAKKREVSAAKKANRKMR
jgi:hypothetical protein